MKRVEIFAQKHASKLTPLVPGVSSRLIACTPAVLATAAFVAAAIAGTAVRNVYGFDARAEQPNSVDSVGEDMTVGDLLRVLR